MTEKNQLNYETNIPLRKEVAEVSELRNKKSGRKGEGISFVLLSLSIPSS